MDDSTTRSQLNEIPTVQIKTQNLRFQVSATMLDNHHEDFDPLRTDEPAAIYADFDKLRPSCPVSWTSKHGGYWQLIAYEDVKAAAMDSITFISSVKAVVPSDPRGTRRPPLNFDAPEHTPYRTALDRTLKASRINRLREVLVLHAETELQPMLDNGGGDISGEYGARFPAWVETEWLNLEPDAAPVLAATAAAWVNAWRAEEKERIGFFSEKMYGIARDLLENRRRVPRDPEEDPASSLLLERGPDGGPLDEIHLMLVFSKQVGDRTDRMQRCFETVTRCWDGSASHYHRRYLQPPLQGPVLARRASFQPRPDSSSGRRVHKNVCAL